MRVDTLPPDLAKKVWKLAAIEYMTSSIRFAQHRKRHATYYVRMLVKKPPKCVGVSFENRTAFYLWRGVRSGMFKAPMPLKRFRSRLEANEKKWASIVKRSEAVLEDIRKMK